MSGVLPDKYSYTTKPDKNALFQCIHVVIVEKFEELILLVVGYDENASEDRIEIWRGGWKKWH